MKICRNGVEIELTPEEIRNSYYEYKDICLKEDVLSEIVQNPNIQTSVDEKKV